LVLKCLALCSVGTVALEGFGVTVFLLFFLWFSSLFFGGGCSFMFRSLSLLLHSALVLGRFPFFLLHESGPFSPLFWPEVFFLAPLWKEMIVLWSILPKGSSISFSLTGRNHLEKDDLSFLLLSPLFLYVSALLCFSCVKVPH